jgi:hypothetical protein
VDIAEVSPAVLLRAGNMPLLILQTFKFGIALHIPEHFTFYLKYITFPFMYFYPTMTALETATLVLCK